VKREIWGDEKRSRRPWIGVRGADHPEGCRLERVDENGPAFKAGIRIGDVVTKMNGRQITDSSTFLDQVSQASPGDELTLEIKRDDQDMSLSLTVEARARRR